MRYDDASQSGSTGHSEPVARPDEDRLPPGSFGPATGNAITGAGTTSGASGADSVGAGPATITAVQGSCGGTVSSNGAYQASGQYGLLSMDMQGNFSYVRNPGTPDGVKDVFNYTLADATGANSSTTLTIDIGQIAAAAAGQGIVSLPAGVELSDIHVNGRDLIVNMPDGTQMVIPGGAVFVPQIVIGDVQVPPTNLAALLIDNEPQPAAGPPQSSGGNFADPVPPLDPGAPLGDLIPPTELHYTPPEFNEIGQVENQKPTVVIEPHDLAPGAVDAVDQVNEKGLPTREGNLPNEPAGSGEIADGNGTNDSDPSEHTFGQIVFTSGDGLQSITVDGVAITASSIGTTIQGQFGVMTITSVNLAAGTIGYNYVLSDNTSGDNTADHFTVVVTDTTGDTATATLTVDIIDDVPIARNDTDAITGNDQSTDGNVMTGAGTTSGAAGADTVGADNATVTGAHPGASGGFTSVPQDGSGVTIHGTFGDLVLHDDGSYTYTRSDIHQGGTDVFTYQLTDGDGDTSTATLTITVPQVNQPPVVEGSSTNVSEEGLVGGNPDSTGSPDTTNSATASGNIGASDPDNDALTISLQAPSGSFTSGGVPVTWAVSDNGHTLTGSAGGNAVITITIDNSGHYGVTLNGPLDDPNPNAEDSVSITVPVSVSDGLATTPGTLVVTVEDDSPVVNPTVNAEATVTLDETGPAVASTIDTGAIAKGDDPDVAGSGAISSATSGSAIVNAHAAFGGDGPAASDALTYALSITNASSGLTTTDGSAINLVMENGVIVGVVSGGAFDGEAAFAISINSNTGVVTVEQYLSLDHPDTSNPNDALHMLTGSVGVTVTATDADGDHTTSGAVDVSNQITFLDDGPTVSPTLHADATVTLDETGPAVASTISTGVIVKGDDPDVAGSGAISSATSGTAVVDAHAVFGADGPAVSGSLAYALSITNGSSGLTTTDGSAINLVMENGVIVGVVSGGAFDGEAAFAISINSSTGVVTVEQYLSLDHPDASNPNDALHMLTGSVGVTVTATDGDGDHVTSGAVDISNQITFLDDGPTVNPTVHADATVVLDESGPAVAAAINTGVVVKGDDPDVAGSGAISKATSGVAIVDAHAAFGADGPATSDSLSYALSITNASSGLTTTDGSAINLVTQGGVIVGVVSGGAFDGEAAFAISINSSTGVVTVEQYLSINHPVTTDPNDALHMLTGSVGVTVTATDGDGDHVTSGAVDVSNQITFHDDGPTAHADTNSVSEGGTVTGNVETNDLFGADGKTAGGGVTGVEAGSHTGDVVTTGVGSPIAGTFGTLTLNADGSYTYHATANTNPPPGSTDVFTYTIKDGDGDPSTTTLTINVNDVTLNPDDQTKTVNEAALDLNKDGNDLAAGTVTGSNPSSTAETVQGTLNVVGATGYTAEDLTGTHGVLHLNANGTYTYTLTSPVDGTTADNGTNTVNGVESFTYTAHDADGNTVQGTITINVVDDVPTAHADTNSVGEGSSVNGNVLTNDVLGADGGAPGGTVTGVATGSNTASPVSGGVGTDIPGAFGTLHLNANGTYTYTANPDSVTSNQVDHFVYTITDGDGDTSTTTLDITVNNVTLVADDQTKTVNEAALDTTTTGNDLGHGTVTGSNPGSTAETVTGQLAVTGSTGITYTPISTTTAHGIFQLNADGSYTYTLTNPVTGATADNGTNTVNGVETFNYTATDAHGNTVHGTVTVNVVDDVPTANADVDSVTEDGPLVADGNVLTGSGGSDVNITDGVADVQGADGATVTGVKLPASVGFTAVSGGGTMIVGAHGTLTIHADGSYSYALNNADSAVQALGQGQSTSDIFNYQLTDGDGDKSATTLTITINGTNDAPVVGNSTANVSEEGLTGANPDSVGSPTDTTNSVVATGTVSFTDVDSGDTHTVTLTAPANGSLKSDGFNVIWTGSGTNTLHAFQDANGNGVVDVGEKAIATITINNSGNYTVTLQGPIDHADPTTEDINSFGVTVNVSDGHVTSTGTLTVNVEDDSPVNFTPDPQPSLVDDGTASATGLINDPAHNATGVNFIGADGFGSLLFTGTSALDGTALTDASNNPLTSHGQPILLSGFGTGTLTAYVDSGAHAGFQSGEDTVVFTVTLNDGTTYGSDATYTINFSDTVDNGSGVSFNNLTSTNAGNVDYRGVGADSTAQPIDVLLSATSGGAIATVNTDSTSIGVGNQSLNVGDSVRIDFVSDLTSGGAGPTGFNFTGHDSSNGFVGLIPQVQGNQAQTVSFTVYALNTTLTQAGAPDSDPTGNFSDASILTTTNVFAQDYLTGNTATLDISGLAVNSTTAVGNFGVTVTKNADGSVTFHGIQEGDHYGVTTSTDFNAIVVKDTSGSFDVGTFALSQTNAGHNIDMNFGVTAHDADGDPSTGTIAVTLVPDGVQSQAVVHTAVVSQTLLDTSSLTSSNDNDHQRGFASGNNAAMLGAVAAAGLESLQGVQSGHGSGQGIDHASISQPMHDMVASATPLDSVHVDTANVQLSMALAGTGHAPQHGGGSAAHDMVVSSQPLTPADSQPNAAPTELLHGSEAPAHAQGAIASAVTAMAVAMPSAEQLAAAGSHGVAPPQNSVAGGAPQHDQVVSKVLVDALHGGGSAPNIDTLLNGVSSHGTAQDALQALASHGASAVSFGHMAFADAFGGAHGMLSQTMMVHPDAVAPVHG